MHEKFYLNLAVEIATQAHEGQADNQGVPYIEHPLAVMNMVHDEDTKIVAILHDVIEDTEIGIDQLRELGCPVHILDAVLLVTHDLNYGGTEEEYMAKIQKIIDSGNQMAIDVKWADLTHNSDLSRTPNPTEKELHRREKYQKSKVLLRPVVSEYLREI
jgi:(p)ppGpp synthase/HD superfamily hydrolase